MTAKTLEAQRRLPYAPEALCRMVGDVRTYPDFIPWIEDLKVTCESEVGGVREAIAHVRVGWKSLQERFSTKVRCAPAEGEVDVSLVSGPFRTLRNEWRFKSDGAGGSLVKFWIAYDFKNPILNAIVKANREKVIERIMAAFEAEAARRCAAAHA
ncbi:MAG: type II toxin-antitoxin system RatA family toxin [Alphaproteobacteria bacterium]|nr:type II toxin-antitoxin system RatA family toxin [Alphaproteobacteria bacterium]